MQTFWLLLLTVPILTIDILFLIILIRYHQAKRASQTSPHDQLLALKTKRLKHFRYILMIALVLVTLAILAIVFLYPNPASSQVDFIDSLTQEQV